MKASSIFLIIAIPFIFGFAFGYIFRRVEEVQENLKQILKSLKPFNKDSKDEK